MAINLEILRSGRRSTENETIIKDAAKYILKKRVREVVESGEPYIAEWFTIDNRKEGTIPFKFSLAEARQILGKPEYLREAMRLRGEDKLVDAEELQQAAIEIMSEFEVDFNSMQEDKDQPKDKITLESKNTPGLQFLRDVSYEKKKKFRFFGEEIQKPGIVTWIFIYRPPGSNAFPKALF